MFVIADKRHGHWGLASSLTFESLKGAEDYAKTLVVTFGSVTEFHIYELVNPVVVKRREEIVAANL
jgi:hypothetical protein